jgi:hypothetical protein
MAKRKAQQKPVDDIGYEFEQMVREAYASVEQSLQLEDAGWITLGTGTSVITAQDRINTVKKARVYAAKDPMCKQAIRLWTDYGFGSGMTWNCQDERAAAVLEKYWYDPRNSGLLSSKGQRKCSKVLLTDGEIFLALFLGSNGQALIRRIDCLEITELITDPDDTEDVKWYKREWFNTNGQSKVAYYRSPNSLKGEDMPPGADGEAIVFHLTFDGLDQRGESLLQPVIDWVKLHRQFLSSRAAVMLALSKFAWEIKAKGGQSVMDTMKAKLHGEAPASGSTAVTNESVSLNPIKTDSGAANAYQDGRQLKLQLCAGVGWPEQYFGDIACYSADTDVLTEDGWVRHQDWSPGVKVASYNPETHQIDYIAPLTLRVYPFKGNMVHFVNAQTDICVTPNHRMWTAPLTQWKLQPPRSNPSKGGRRSISEGGKATLDRSWQMREADYLFDHPRTHGWKFENSITSQVDGIEYDPLNTNDPEAWADFMGYFISEGYTLSETTKMGQVKDRIYYRVAISQKEGQILNNMRTVLRRCGWNFHEQVNQTGVISLTIVNKALWQYLRSHCGLNSHDKRIPREFFSATRGLKRELLLSLMEGDGGPANGQGSGGYRYSTVSKQLADDVQELALLLGYSTSKALEDGIYNNQRSQIWRVAIRDKRLGTQILPKHVYKVAYDGLVYCFALPKNHIYITRRNGKVAIQGNTGNLATAKTVELPVAKMIESYQAIWSDFYDQIDQLILERAGIAPDKRYVDRDFPPVIPSDDSQMADNISKISLAMPELLQSRDVMQMALMSLGVKDPNEAIDQIMGQPGQESVEWQLSRALKNFKEIIGGGNGNGHKTGVTG